MLALIPLALQLAPMLARWFGGDTAGAVATQAAELVRTVTGTDDPAEAEAILVADPAKRAELQIRLAEIANAKEAAYYADIANARARDTALQSSGKRNVRADVMVALTIVGIIAGLGFLASGLIEKGSDAAGATIGMVGLFTKCFADAFQFEFGSSRGSAEKSAASERLTAAVLDQRQAAAPAIINQPSGTIVTGGTAEDLNDASLRAARGG